MEKCNSVPCHGKSFTTQEMHMSTMERSIDYNILSRIEKSSDSQMKSQEEPSTKVCAWVTSADKIDALGHGRNRLHTIPLLPRQWKLSGKLDSSMRKQATIIRTYQHSGLLYVPKTLFEPPRSVLRWKITSDRWLVPLDLLVCSSAFHHSGRYIYSNQTNWASGLLSMGIYFEAMF